MITMTLDDLKKTPLTENDRNIIAKAKPIITEDCPEQTDEQLKQFKPWYVVHPERTKVYIEIDNDVLQWYQKQGKKCQSKMNEALRTYAFG